MNRPLAALACVLLASAASAAPVDAPTVFAKLKPKVGSWAEYSVVSTKDGEIKNKATFHIAIVGKTDEGIWIEQRGKPEIPKPKRPDAAATMKMLTGKDGVIKAYVKTPRGVMDMTSMMTGARRKPAAAAADGAKLTEVAEEKITVPAGDFKTTHYSVVNQKSTGDMWVKTGTGPWGLIKQVHTDGARVTTLELLSSGDDATSEVDETTAQAFPGMGMGRPAAPDADSAQDSARGAADDAGAAAPAAPSAGSVLGNVFKSRFGH